MAAALDLSNEVLAAFAYSHRQEMTLMELNNILIGRKIRISNDELLRTVRSPGLLNLFNLQSVTNNLSLIQLRPELTLCEACLQKSCKRMNCRKLHLCCYTSHFSNKPPGRPCNFPHKLSEHPNNIILLRDYNYDTLNQDLLLDLLRLYYKNNEQPRSEDYMNSRRSSSTQHNRNRSDNTYPKTPIPRPFSSRPEKSLIQPAVLTDNVAERQLDISIPSEKDAPEIDLEMVQLILATKDLIIEQTLEKQTSNDFYRRYTIQFKTKQVVDNILQNEPIIIYNNIPIKMKRTLREKDKKIFALKFNTDKKIDNVRLNLYVETLVGKVNPNIFDMTSDGSDEQIHLIRCEQPIDFDHLYKVHSAKNSLQSYRVTVIEVYEAESLEVSFVYSSLHPSMTKQRLCNLFGESRWQQDVFACLCIHSQNSADIELMNAEVTAKWLSEANRIEHDLSLIIHPIIDFIQSAEKNEEEDEEITKLLAQSKLSSPLSPSNASEDSQKNEYDPNVYLIKPDWRIVLAHPVFGDEYRKYIRENLNISAQITGSVIQVPNEHIRKELARYTNMFTQTFLFQELRDLDKTQLKKVKENYPRMAHKWQKDTNITLIAARRDVMNELFPYQGSATRQQNKAVPTPIFRDKQSPNFKKPEQQSPTFRKQEEHLPSFRKPGHQLAPYRKQEEQSSIFRKPEEQPPPYRPQESTVRKPEQQSSPYRKQEEQSGAFRKQDRQSLIVEEPVKEPRSIISQSQMTTEDNSHTLSYPIENNVYFPFFALSNSFPDRLNTYLSSIFNVKLDIKPVSSTRIILELKGQYKDVSNARPALTSLFASLKTKTYSDSDKFAIPDLYRVVQWNLDQSAVVSSCSFSTKNGGTLSVRYFADNRQFGVDEQKIDDIITHNFTDVSYQVSITSKNLERKLEELQKKIEQRSDYGHDICCLYNYQKGSTDNTGLPALYLCGKNNLIQPICQEVKNIIDKYTPVLCNIPLTSQQVNFLLQICPAELIELENQYESDGVDLRSKLKGDPTSQFLSPKSLHEKVKLSLTELSHIQILSRDFKCPVQLINNKKHELTDLATRNRCLLSMTSTPQATRLTSASPKISSGAINISNGDLTTEQCDVLVVCSSSTILYNSIIKVAGIQVEQELIGKDLTRNIIDTSAGQLKQAKRLLFLPWTPSTLSNGSPDMPALGQSISAFVQKACNYAIRGKFQSIAFPAIGCGRFGLPADIIASFMIDEAQEQVIANPSNKLLITFVIQQQNVFDVFNAKLKSTLTTAVRAGSSSPPPLTTSDKVNITVVTSHTNGDVANNVLKKIEDILTSSFSS